MKIDFDMNNERTQRKIGIIAVILGIILIAGIGLYFLFSDNSDVKEPLPDNGEQEEQIDKVKRQAMIDEINADAGGEEDIDTEKAKTVMGLRIVIADEILDLYLDGNAEKLQEEMENFLVEYDFYMDVTKATCTQIITMDYKKEIAYIEFKLNDPARTILTLEYKEHNEYEFNFR
ncbi:hypothetical protein [Emergencia sp. 1XD21-10]|uniref:hypothetical protein n=1 Tax=Emergencia sp. 1XD21-10 TaxID=2304569 RepID=UPI0013798140|nr:hypothetical protein [Emergencia sp. 1XD21-10]NCF00523.1 hypothetical protein [Emergencia sp. 1XD21-10]